MKKLEITSITPVHNEKENISEVLNILESLEEIKQIICIDDGSTDGTAELIQENHPNVKLLKHQHNIGKSEAILTSIPHIKNDWVLMFDGDLSEINKEDIQIGIKKLSLVI